MIRHYLTLIWNRKRSNLLIMVEIFMSFLVVFGVLTVSVHFANNWRQTVGFAIADVWNVQVNPRTSNFDAEAGRIPREVAETAQQLTQIVKEFPEVLALGWSTAAPYGDSRWTYGSNFGTWHLSYSVSGVTDGFQSVLGLEVTKGRWFDRRDDGTAWVPVVVNERLAREIFGDTNPIGNAIPQEKHRDGTMDPELRVVGVIRAYRQDGELSAPENYAFRRRLLDGPEQNIPNNLLVRLRPGTTAAFEEKLVRRMQAVAKDWSFEVQPLEQMREDRLKSRLAPLIAAGVIAGFLMLMVGMGLTGVLWQTVTQRTREMGLRRAKGATVVDIRTQILGELVVMTSVAVLAGALLVLQFPLLKLTDVVTAGTYTTSLVLSALTIYLLTIACAWYRAAWPPEFNRQRRCTTSRRGDRPAPSEADRPVPSAAEGLWLPMILIVDDDPSVTASLALVLKQAGHASHAVSSPALALAWLQRESCDLVLQDMNFSRRTSGDEGLELLGRIRVLRPHLPVILITAWGSIALAVAGMKAGASDFVTKPWTNQQVLQSVETVLGVAATRPSTAAAPPTREDLDARYDFGTLVGNDPRLLRILEIIGRVSATDASVLITGESGTGKELIAEAVHRNSRRQHGPFVKVNLGGISSTLFESEMFGHVRGAFTDARTDRKGRFETAAGGTIFLDEIGDLDAASQVKLLRVLQDRTFEVLGSSVRRTVDVRVVAATNRNLPERVDRGAFREDLLYRINLIAVHLPPLRERRDDIPILAGRFLQTLAEVYRRDSLSMSAAAVKWLQNLSWPGNVRQLRQWVERTVLVTSKPVLEVGDFMATSEMERPETHEDTLPPVGSMTLDAIEKSMIEKSLRHHGGNISRVAESLGLSRAALYRRLEKYRDRGVTIRRWFIVYVAGVHLVATGVAFYFLREQPPWLLGLEVLLVISLACGLLLTRQVFSALSLVPEAQQLLDDGDFMSRVREVGQPEVDSVIRLFNRMSDQLRDERVRLQEQQHFLSRILAVSPLGILFLDFDGRVAYVNPSGERLLQQEASELLGRRLAGVSGPVAEALAALAVDASCLVSLWGGRRVRCQRGSFVDRGFARDYLLVEELTEELRQFEKAAYGKLIRMMSHEVNNSVGASNSLLHSCLNYAGSLPEEHRADFESALSIAIGRTNQLGAFMQGFADVIRLPAPVLQPCEVREILDGVAALLKPACDERRVAWRWAMDVPLPPVPMDRVQMEQVFINLAKNALEAIGKDGVITVRSCRKDGRPAAVVEDTGPGLSAEARQNLFTPFFSTKEHGQGIGLTLVQEILAQHRFQVSLDSEPGGPTRFTVVF